MTAVRQAGDGQPRGVSGADEISAMPASPDRQPDVRLAAAVCLLRACSARGWTITHHDELRYWSAERTSDDGRQIRFICARTATEMAAKIGAAEAGAVSGTFETALQAQEHPEVCVTDDAMHASAQSGVMAGRNHRMLVDACTAAGVELGTYDHRILLGSPGASPRRAQ